MNYKQSIYLHIFTIFFVLLGSVETVLSNVINFSLLNIQHNLIKTSLIILIGISILYHIFNKYTYLPFLNYNVLPSSLLKTENNLKKEKLNNFVSIDIDIPKDNSYTHLLYWASDQKDTNAILPWDVAYGDFKNSGVELIQTTGKLNINIECPSSYTVPSLVGKKIIPQHIHYRFASKDGMISPIYTKYIKC